MSKIKKLPWLLIILAVSITINLGLIYNKVKTDTKPSPKKQTETYPYLARRITLENFDDILINFLPLRTNLRETVKPWGETFAFFFEYLPTGTSIGVNEKQEFDAASLLKVPIVMAYYHQKEKAGLALATPQVTIKPEQIDKKFGTLWQQGAGTQISLDEAVNLALTKSDNTAAMVLADNVPIEDFNAVYEGLDIDMQAKQHRITINAKSYSSILKSLFFSASLTKNDSEEILDILTKTDFNDKLPAPLPKEIKVAHKIGVFVENSLYQDCGIVYAPQRPYLLCMISQSQEDEARSRMQKISKTVYDYVSKANEPVGGNNK